MFQPTASGRNLDSDQNESSAGFPCSSNDITGQISCLTSTAFSQEFYIACSLTGFTTFNSHQYKISPQFTITASACVEGSVDLRPAYDSIQILTYNTIIGYNTQKLIFPELKDFGSCNSFAYEIWQSNVDSPIPGLSIAHMMTDKQIHVAPISTVSARDTYTFRIVAKYPTFNAVFTQDSVSIFTWKFIPCTSDNTSLNLVYNSHGQAQWVSPGAAKAFYVMHTVTSSNSECPIHLVEVRSASDSSVLHADLGQPEAQGADQIIKPNDPDSVARYEFVVVTQVIPGIYLMKTYSLNIGCPADGVNLVPSSFPYSLLPTQYSDANSLRYYLPGRQVDSPAGKCQIDFRALSSVQASYTAYTGNDLSPIRVNADGNYYVEPAPLITTGKKFQFYLCVQVDYANNGPAIMSQLLTFVVNCAVSFQTFDHTVLLDVANPDFEFPEAQTSFADCTIGAHKLLSSNSQTSGEFAHTTQPASSSTSGFQKISKVSLSLAPNNAYYAVQLTGADNWVIDSTPLQITISNTACSSVSITSTAMVSPQIRDNSKKIFELANWQVNPSGCSIQTISATLTDSTTTQISGFNFVSSASPQHLAYDQADQVLVFYLYLTTVGANTYLGPYKLITGCPSNGNFNTITLTSFPGSVGTFQHVPAGNSDSSRPTQFALIDYTLAYNYCPVDFLQMKYYTSMSKGTQVTTLELPTAGVSEGVSARVIVPKDLSADHYYQFHADFKTTDGATKLTVMLDFMVGCPVTYNARTISFLAFPSSYSSSQTVSLGATQQFIHPLAIVTDFDYCPIQYTALASDGVTDISSSFSISEITLGSDKVVNIVPVISQAVELRFFLRAQMMAMQVISAERVLYVGCPVALLSFTDPTPLVSNLVIGTDFGEVAYTTASFTSAISGLVSNCAIAQVAPVQVKIGAASAPPGTILKSSSCSSSSCFNVRALSASEGQTLKFKFKITLTNGGQWHLSPEYEVHWACGVSSTSMAFLVSQEGKTYSLFQGQTGPLELPAIQCSVCCTTLSYYASTSGLVKESTSPFLSSLTATSSAVKLFFNTASIVAFDIYLHATTTQGGNEVTGPIHIEVVYGCADDQIELSKDPPSILEMSSLGSSGIIYPSEGGEFKIWITLQTGSSRALKVDITPRFSKRSPRGSCELTAFQIDKVVNLTSGKQVQLEAWGENLQISPEGLLTATAKDPLEADWELYLSASNSFLRSNSTATGSLVRVQLSSSPISLPNIAPVFVEEVVAFESVIKPSTPGQLAFPLPKIFDANSDVVDIKVSDKPEFLSLDRKTFAFIVDSKLIPGTSNTTVTLILEDRKGAFTEYSFSFSFKVEGDDDDDPTGLPEEEESSLSDEENSSKEEESPEKEAKDYEKPVAAWISSIDSFGNVEISFNASMRSDINISSMSSSNTNITLELAEDDSVEEDTSRVAPAFTWAARSFSKDTLRLKLDFEQPFEVSRSVQQDLLKITFSEEARRLFYSPKQRQFLHKDFAILSRKIRRQLEDNLATRSLVAGAESGEISLRYLLIITFCLNVVLSGGMRHLLLLFRCLQIILHLPLIKVAVPANVSVFFSLIIPVVTFDVLDPEWTTEFIFNFDEPKQAELSSKLTPQLIDLGYETHNSLLSLGSLSIFTTIYLMELATAIGLTVTEKMTAKRFSFLPKLKECLLFGDLIALIIDAYFEFMISGYLALGQPLFSKSGEVTSVIFGYLSLTLALGFLNFGMFKLVSSPLSLVQTDEFSSKWGQLLENVSPSSKLKAVYFPCFVARRFAMLVIIFFVAMSQFQLLGIIGLNMATFIYIGSSKALQWRICNQVDIANEVFISTVTLNLLMFTDWMDDLELQYKYGWCMIAFITIVIAINFYFVIKMAFHQISIFARVGWRKLERMLALQKPQETSLLQRARAIVIFEGEQITENREGQTPSQKSRAEPSESQEQEREMSQMQSEASIDAKMLFWRQKSGPNIKNNPSSEAKAYGHFDEVIDPAGETRVHNPQSERGSEEEIGELLRLPREDQVQTFKKKKGSKKRAKKRRESTQPSEKKSNGKKKSPLPILENEEHLLKKDNKSKQPSKSKRKKRKTTKKSSPSNSPVKVVAKVKTKQ